MAKYTGMAWFSLSTKTFNDLKIRRLRAKYGMTAYGVLILLWQKIYDDNGYYIEVNDDFIFFVADDCRIDSELLRNIILESVEVGLFDKNIYNQYNTLTSRTIIMQYLEGSRNVAKREFYREYIPDSITEKEILSHKTSRLKEIIIISKFNNANSNAEAKNNNAYAVGENAYANDNNAYANCAQPHNAGTDTPFCTPNLNININTNIKEEEGNANFSNLPPVEPKIDFLDNIISIFADEYEISRKQEYIITTKGKERKGAGILANYIRKKRPEIKTDEALLELQALFRNCLAVKESFLNRTISINQISTRLNEYLQTIEKEKSSGKTNGSGKAKLGISDILKSKAAYFQSQNGGSIPNAGS